MVSRDKKNYSQKSVLERDFLERRKREKIKLYKHSLSVILAPGIIQDI